VPHARLLQELLPEDTFGDPHPGAHWCKALCMSPQVTFAFTIYSFSIQECKAPGCGQRFSQLGNLKVCNPSLCTQTLADLVSRRMRGAILESARTAAMFAAKHLHSVAMFVHTRLFTNRSSPSPADWMIVGSSSPSLETSRYVILTRVAGMLLSMHSRTRTSSTLPPFDSLLRSSPLSTWATTYHMQTKSFGSISRRCTRTPTKASKDVAKIEEYPPCHHQRPPITHHTRA
jgi:hypothetical protein